MTVLVTKSPNSDWWKSLYLELGVLVAAVGT